MALPDTVGLHAGTSRTSGIANASIASGSNYLGSVINNATNLDDIGDFEAVWSYGVAPTANTSLTLHILYAFDGVNYEEGDGVGTGTGDVDPLAGTLVGSITPPADTAGHRKMFGDVALLPYPFKLLVRNVDTGQTVTMTVNARTRKAAQVND